MKSEENIIFNGINQEDRCRMIKCFDTEKRKYKSGSLISDYYNPETMIGVVLSGSVIMVTYDVNGTRNIIERIEKQGIFGKLFTFSISYKNNVETICEENCEILFFRYEDLTKRCAKSCQCHSQVIENLLNLISEKAILLSERIEVLCQRSIEDKLLCYLNIIKEKTPDGTNPRIPFSITALSDYLCVNRSALQRTIKKMREDGTLSIKNRYFDIK
jgi:CRP-like cAMP-binding protein